MLRSLILASMSSLSDHSYKKRCHPERSSTIALRIGLRSRGIPKLESRLTHNPIDSPKAVRS